VQKRRINKSKKQMIKEEIRKRERIYNSRLKTEMKKKCKKSVKMKLMTLLIE